MAPTRIRLRFSGQVQGVGFRQFVHYRSGPLGVSGHVENRPDGTVEAQFEGEPEAIRELERVLHEELRSARIDHVDREVLPIQGSRPPVRVR